MTIKEIMSAITELLEAIRWANPDEKPALRVELGRLYDMLDSARK